MDLFETLGIGFGQPLAERARPQDLSEFVGHQKVIAPLLAVLKRHNSLPNTILWGPPGTGKTTLAGLLANQMQAHLISANAIDTGAKKLREIGAEARDRRLIQHLRTVLFIDEIHRLNRGQQDVLLPFSEKGDWILIGATTENPSYELNSALLSRSRVVRLEGLTEENLRLLSSRVLGKEGHTCEEFLTNEAWGQLFLRASGDARKLLNDIEQLLKVIQDEAIDLPLNETSMAPHLSASPIIYDKNKDEHYNCISAFIKSIRGSDPNAGLYYLARMIVGGEDPKFIARRLVILASEDVGNADPRALQVAISGLKAVEAVGLPEAEINLAQVVTYLACAPKSNRSYLAYKKAKAEVERTGSLPVPKALRSAQTQLAKSLGYGDDYKYSHDGKKGFIEQKFLPVALLDAEYYEPSDRGFEKTIRQYMEWVRGAGATRSFGPK